MEVLLKNNVNLHAKSIIQIFGIIWINIQYEFGQTVQDSGRCYCSVIIGRLRFDNSAIAGE